MNHRGDAPSTGRPEARPDHASSMLTGLLLWLCSLPLIGLLVFPWFGMRVALVVALALLAVTVSACYALCTWQVVASSEKGNSRRPT